MHESDLCAFAPLRETFFSHDRMNKKQTSRKDAEKVYESELYTHDRK